MKKKVPPSSEPFDCELAKQKVKEQLCSGKSLFGEKGAFAPLLQEMLNSILEGGMEGHLDEEERDGGNRKNGKSKKKLKTSSGTIEVTTPRDALFRLYRDRFFNYLRSKICLISGMRFGYWRNKWT